MDDLDRERLGDQLRYLETWGTAYMYLYAITFIVLLVGVAIWAVTL